MNVNQVIGIVLLVIGILLVYFGFQATESVAEQMHESFTGRYTETTMWYLIGGGAAAVAGLVLMVVDVFPTTD